MGSIRPLITISILVFVGGFLYVKINEGPTQLRTGTNSGASQSPDGVPPLAAAAKGASLAADSSAPAWPTAAPVTAPPPLSAAPATGASTPSLPVPTTSSAQPGDAKKDNMPLVPPIPELPELPANNLSAAPANPPALAPPKDLPANTPTAQYPDVPGPNASSGAPNNNLTPLTPLPIGGSNGPKTNATASATLAPITPPSAAPSTPAASSPAASGAQAQPAQPALGTASATLPPLSSAQNPLRPATPPGTSPPEADRYGIATTPQATTSALAPAPPTPATANQPPTAEATFAASWPAIQASLDRGDLKQAHQLLSKWHGNETLTPAESEKVETLLGQLAGTVIYSTEHRLEPPRVVKQGETLDMIAKEYNVTPTLLAKINNIQSPEQLRPGQELKVVRGPFTAVVDLHRSEVTLLVDDRYAGKFHVTVPPGGLTDGQWVVDQKIMGPPSTANPSAYATTPVPADRTIILRNAATGGLSTASPTLLIASGAAPSGLTAPAPPALKVTPQDAEELSDILSVGSRVIVRK